MGAGLSFLAPIISLSMLTVRFLPVKTGESILTSMKQGFAFIRRQGAMEILIVLAFCMTFLAVPARTFLPVYARDIFHRGAETLALFVSLSGLGSIIGALTVAALGNVRNKGRLALTMLICLGAAMAGFALSTSIVTSCVMLFLFGGAMIGAFTMVSSLVQLITPNEMRGQVTAVYLFMFIVFGALGSQLIGSITLRVFRSDADLWKSIVLTASILMPLAAFAISRGIRPYGREVERLEREAI